MQTFFKTAAVDQLPMQKYTWKMASNSLKNPGILWLQKSGNPGDVVDGRGRMGGGMGDGGEEGRLWCAGKL